MYWKIACLLMRTGHLPSVDAVVLQMMPRGFGPNADDLVVGGPCFIDTGREELIGRLALPFLSRAEGFQMTDHVHARHNSGSARKERRLPQLPCSPCLRSSASRGEWSPITREPPLAEPGNVHIMQGCLCQCMPSTTPCTRPRLSQLHEHAFAVDAAKRYVRILELPAVSDVALVSLLSQSQCSLAVCRRRRCGRASDIRQSLAPDSCPSPTATESATLHRPCTVVPARARAMTTFAPTSQPNSDLPDAPHHHQHPPPPHLPHGAFAHQLNPPASFTPNAPQVSRRASRDLRHHPSNGAMAGPNGNGPMAVPRMANGNGHGGNAREVGFNGARSPPNNKSRCLHTGVCLHSADCPRHLTCALQVLPARRVPGWKSLPVPALGRAHYRARALQVLHKGGTSAHTCQTTAHMS
jgi:hypothetical protein